MTVGTSTSLQRLESESYYGTSDIAALVRGDQAASAAASTEAQKPAATVTISEEAIAIVGADTALPTPDVKFRSDSEIAGAVEGLANLLHDVRTQLHDALNDPSLNLSDEDKAAVRNAYKEFRTNVADAFGQFRIDGRDKETAAQKLDSTVLQALYDFKYKVADQFESSGIEVGRDEGHVVLPPSFHKAIAIFEQKYYALRDALDNFVDGKAAPAPAATGGDPTAPAPGATPSDPGVTTTILLDSPTATTDGAPTPAPAPSPFKALEAELSFDLDEDLDLVAPAATPGSTPTPGDVPPAAGDPTPAPAPGFEGGPTPAPTDTTPVDTTPDVTPVPGEPSGSTPDTTPASDAASSGTAEVDPVLKSKLDAFLNQLQASYSRSAIIVFAPQGGVTINVKA